ncbi:MAG: hypothetical protein ACOYVD_02645 [Bacillota bacterium]
MTKKTRHEQQISPGPFPVDPVLGLPICPPPSEIDLIKVTKVFNECIHSQVEEVLVECFLGGSTSKAAFAECVSANANNISCIKVGGDIVRIGYDLEVCTKVPLNIGGFTTSCSTSRITKNLKIDRAHEQGLDTECQVFPQCLLCFISGRDPFNNVTAVTCCIGILVVLKLTAEVQLLVPTYGYPAPPPECRQLLGECPTDFTPHWPPYPQQKAWAEKV